MKVRPEQVGNENQNARGLEEDADSYDQIQGVPTAPRLVGINAARHSEKAGNMHEIDGQMEADDEEPEVQFAESLVVHFPGHLRKPIIEGAKSRKKNAAYNDVMKVGDHEVGIPEVPREGHGAQHYAREASNQELKEKAYAEQHGRFEMNLPAPHGGQPVKDLDACRNSDSHGRENEKGVDVRTHANREHMVGPYAHGYEGNADRGRNHDRVAENRFAGENRDYL